MTYQYEYDYQCITITVSVWDWVSLSVGAFNLKVRVERKSDWNVQFSVLVQLYWSLKIIICFLNINVN